MSPFFSGLGGERNRPLPSPPPASAEGGWEETPRRLRGRRGRGFPPRSHKGGELPRDTPARDRGVGDCRQALLGDIVEDVQDAQTPPAGELIVDKVDGPARVRLGLDQDWGLRAGRSLAAAPPAHAQALLTIKALGLLAIERFALAPQQDVKASIAEAPALGREFPQPET